MKTGLSFLVAARQCEIAELEHLARTSQLVEVIGRLIHALQRERGMSNLFLGSAGQRFGDQRLQQVAQCEHFEQEVRQCFDGLDTHPTLAHNGARLFSRIAIVLHALEALPPLRQRIRNLELTAREATDCFVKLIAGLLAVVFEAADSASDPKISRVLVALFNFMQGKEFAGQERALGSVVFASGRIDATGQSHWRRLIDSQQACLRTFSQYADAPGLTADEWSEDPRTLAELERLRHVGFTLAAHGPVDTKLSQVWYDRCTRRIDSMKIIEDRLSVHLRQLCANRIAHAKAELSDQQATLESLSHQLEVSDAAPARYGPHLERSVVELVQQQAHRLQSVSDELETVRAALNERKVIERAKGLLMTHRQLSEDEAYRTLRQMAMNKNRKLADVAEAVLGMADVLAISTRS